MGLIKKGRIKEEGVLYLKEKDIGLERSSSYNAAPEYRDINISEGEDISSVEKKTIDMVEGARNDAQQIINDAVAEAEKIKEDAKESGFEEAKRLAEEGASGRVKESFDTLNEAIKERKKIIKDAEAEVLRLAIKVAEQIIKSEVSLHRDVSLNIVSEAIGKVGDREQIIIKVSRDDIEHIKRFKDKIAGLVDGVKSLSIVEDSGIEPGGCVIETNLGYVDARISTKIKAIEEIFKKVR